MKKLTQKVTSYEKCSYNSSFEVQITWRLLRFNTADVSKYWKIVQFRKISIKIENCKTFYETHTASRFKEIVQPHPPPIPPWIKSYYVFEKKIFLGRYTEICLLEKLQTEKIFWLCFGSISFSILKELRFVKWVKFSEQTFIVKSVIFFCYFLLALRFLLQNPE